MAKRKALSGTSHRFELVALNRSTAGAFRRGALNLKSSPFASNVAVKQDANVHFYINKTGHCRQIPIATGRDFSKNRNAFTFLVKPTKIVAHK